MRTGGKRAGYREKGQHIKVDIYNNEKEQSY